MSNWSFIKHVTDYMTRPRFGEQKAPTLWPSSATGEKNGQTVGKCRRQAFFRYASDHYSFSKEYAHYKEFYEHIKSSRLPRSTYTEWIFRQGDLYEDHCINLAKEAGIFIATQVSVYVPKYNVSGKLDLITINPETNKYHIVEVKSIYGFNSNSILGTDAQQRRGSMGEPRDSHLMQLGIYQWWFANNHDDFGPGLLVYGSRDTGRYGEFYVTVEADETDGLEYIYYQSVVPVLGQKVNTGISIKSIMKNYHYTSKCLEEKVLPPRDYDLRFSDEKISELYEAGELSKADTAQYEKRKKQVEEGKTKLVKKVEKGDWQCRFCDYKNVCYDNNAQEISINLLN
jgi:hypothetical protein